MTHLEEQLKHLPGDILLSIARNDSAEMRGRKAAVSLLYTHGYPQMNHKDIDFLLNEVKADAAAHQEVVDAVETAIEQPIHHPASVAGVTTKTLAYDIDNR